jgi:hypothetical protein
MLWLNVEWFSSTGKDLWRELEELRGQNSRLATAEEERAQVEHLKAKACNVRRANYHQIADYDVECGKGC